MRTLRHALVAATLTTLAACGGATYTGELAELQARLASPEAEAMRVDPESIEDPNLRELQEHTTEALRAAEINYEYAQDAWGGRGSATSREFSRVGLIYYQAAENYARSAEARQRLAAANLLAQEQRERRNSYDDMLRSETELIALLETVVQLFERNEALRREIATMETQYQTESRAVYAIQEARVLQREAEGVKAPDFAREAWATANASLTRATQQFDQGDYEGAYDVALRALEEFRLAIADAQPDFLAEQDRLLSNNQNQAIFEEAQRRFGPELAFVDARGIVVVVPALFERGQSNPKGDRVYLLDEVLALVREYRTRDVLIEGHTQDRGESDVNMNLAQARADEVQNWFLQRSIRGSRLTTAAFGEDAPRFDNRSSGGRADNDRVEIVFLVE